MCAGLGLITSNRTPTQILKQINTSQEEDEAVQGSESSGVQEITFLSMKGGLSGTGTGTGSSCLYQNFNTSFPGHFPQRIMDILAVL